MVTVNITLLSIVIGISFCSVTGEENQESLDHNKNTLIQAIFNKNLTNEKQTQENLCQCVDVKRCKSVNLGEGILNSRFNDEECKSEDEICCDKKDIINVDLSSNTESTVGEKLVTNDNRSCECVQYYLCEEGFINKDGANIIDIRIDENICPTYMQTCCPLESQKEESKIPVTPFEPKSCGNSNPKGVGIAIHTKTTQAEFGEFPWMVAVFQKDNSYLGGGSLIHPKVVLTTAHIIHKKHQDQLFIRAGEWDPQTPNQRLPPQNREIDIILRHEDFNPSSLINDVAMLIVKQSVELAPHINVICLPSLAATHTNEIRGNEECFSGGWGKKSFETSGLYQAILKKIELPLVNRRMCQNMLRKTKLGRHFLLHRSFLCAGGVKGQDTCTGDGGSPLFCPLKNEKNRFEIVGMVAWGIGCGEDGVPGVYANISYLRKWIDEHLSKYNINIKSVT